MLCGSVPNQSESVMWKRPRMKKINHQVCSEIYCTMEFKALLETLVCPVGWLLKATLQWKLSWILWSLASTLGCQSCTVKIYCEVPLHLIQQFKMTLDFNSIRFEYVRDDHRRLQYEPSQRYCARDLVIFTLSVLPVLLDRESVCHYKLLYHQTPIMEAVTPWALPVFDVQHFWHILKWLEIAEIKSIIQSAVPLL